MDSTRAAATFSFGAAAVFTLIYTGHLLWAVAAFLVTGVLMFLLLPRGAWRNGLDKPRIDRSDMRPGMLLPLLIAFLPTFLSPVLDIHHPWVWPVYFFAVAVALWLAFRAMVRADARLTRQRMEQALEGSTPEDVTPEHRAVAAEHAEILQALQKMGAVDGLRAREWLLAQALGRADADLSGEVSRLQRAGLVEVSTLDSGEDTSRHFVDLTPVGVRVLADLSRA